MIWLTASVLFLLYVNAPAVAVRIHGAPFALGALVPMTLAIPVAYRVLIRGEAFRFPLPLIVAVGMLALNTVSALTSIRPFESIDVLQTWLIEGVVLALLVVNAIRTREELRASILAILLAGAVMGAIAVLQQALGPETHSFMGFGQLDSAISDGEGRLARRLAGPIGETNRFAQIMAVLIPIAGGCALVMRGRLRVFCWLAAGLILAGMAFAFSRGAIVALALALPFALGFRLLRWRQVVVAGLLGVLLLLAMPHYAKRVVSIGQIAARSLGLDPTGMRNADGAARGRLTEMKAAGMLFMEYPVLGAGPGLAPYYYEENATVVGGKVRSGTRRSHNLYLQLAAETGVLGLATFLLFVGLVLRELDGTRRRTEKSDRELWAVICGLELALLISLATSFFLHAAYVRYFWMLIGLACAATLQPAPPALVAFLSRALRETADRIRRDQARA